MNKFRLLTACLVIILFVSCGGKKTLQFDQEFNPEKSFTRANELLEEKEYDEARSLLLEVKNRDLSKKFAPLAQLRIADSYEKEEEYDRAVEEYRRFLEIYPDHRHAPYAQYQVAMVYFNQVESPERGYGGAARALQEFERLKEMYPRNPYKEVVEVRIQKCRNIIADYEFLVGEFYEKKGAYESAIGRYLGLLRDFPDYQKEGLVLFRLGMSFKEAGMDEKAREYLTRFIEKYPDDESAKEARKTLSKLKTDMTPSAAEDKPTENKAN